MMNDVLAIILGGGQGSRLFPLTQQRSKPAVPIAGKYRLIDVPISNCLHADLRRIFVLTQFNSASLNHHIAQAYRMDPFSHGFVDIIAAEQTPDNSNWFQGTADAVRRAIRHFLRYDAHYYLILAGDHLYRMDYGRLLDAHVDKDADITIAALPATAEDAPGMGIFRFDRDGTIVGFEEKPDSARLAEIGSSTTPGTPFHNQHFDPEKPFIASLGIYIFSRDVLLDLLQKSSATDFGREIIPAALDTHRVRAYLHDGYWADVGTVESFYDANILLTGEQAPFNFYDPRRPIYTHERFLPPSHVRSCTVRDSIVAEGCFLDDCSIEQSVVGIRTHVSKGTRIRRSVLLGADMYESNTGLPLGVGSNVVLDRVIMDKNAWIGHDTCLTNAGRLPHADGDGYYIRSGVIIVPKGGRIAPGTRI
jgi:glucose-1-phosphate adenylyltransferase